MKEPVRCSNGIKREFEVHKVNLQIDANLVNTYRVITSYCKNHL